jgi:hypothetical protein
VHFFAIAVLKVKLRYDFESIKDNTSLLSELKSALYSIAKMFRGNRKILRVLCVCIGYLVMQAQWTNFVEEIIESFNESLETMIIAFKILKSLVELVKDDDIVISEKRRECFYRELSSQNVKVLEFLEKRAEYVNKGNITEETSLELKFRFTNGVKYLFTIDS